MIVIASDRPEIVGEISTLLRQAGDLFTAADEESAVYTAIRNERASLLIVDTGTSAFNGYALTRAIRDDPAYAGLAVLCIVELTDLSAVLSVLDCRADAFLARPLDLASLSGTISDLQADRAKGTQHGAARTQFRISDGGREYTVVADRRQLLEFLISAFESAIRVRNEQQSIRQEYGEEIRDLNERILTLTAERDATVTNLHGELEERNRTIARLNTDLSAKEQAEMLQKTRIENIAQELKDLGAVLETTRRSEEEKGRMIADLKAEVAAARTEKAAADRDYGETIRALDQKLQKTQAELDTARSALADFKVRNAELERELLSARTEITRNTATIEALEKNLASAVASCNEWEGKWRQSVKTLEEVRSASAAKEREVQTALDNVTGDLNAIQDALEQNIRQLERELAARKDLEQQVKSLTAEREALIRTGEEWQRKAAEAGRALQEAVSASAAKETEIRTTFDSLTASLNAIQVALEQNLRQLERELAVREDLEQQVEALAAERKALSRSGEETSARLAGLMAELAAERETRVRIQTEADALSAEYGQVREVLENTYRELALLRDEHRSLQETQDTSVRTAVQEVSGLRQLLEERTAELAAVREELRREQQQRASAVAGIAELEDKYAGAQKFLDSASRDIGILNTALSEEREKKVAAEERSRAAERECAEKDREVLALRQELDAVRSAATEQGPILVPPQKEDSADVPKESTGSRPTGSMPPGSPPGTEPGSFGSRVPGSPEMPAGGTPSSPGTGTAAGQPPARMSLPVTPPAIPLPVTETPQTEPPALTTFEIPDADAGEVKRPGSPDDSGSAATSPLVSRVPFGDLAISRDRWLDITKWAHHTGSVSEEQRKDLIANLMRLSKLVQKGRHLTNRQEQEIRSLLARVQSLGYRFV